MIMQFRGHSFPRVATTARSRCIAEGHRGGTMLGAKARLSLCVSSTAADQPRGPTMLKNRDYSILASPVGMGGEAPSSNGGGIMAPSAKLSGCSMEPALRFAPQPWAPQFPAASRWPRTGMSARSLVYQQLQQFFCAPAYSCEPGWTALRTGRGSTEPVSPDPLDSVAVLGGSSQEANFPARLWSVIR